MALFKKNSNRKPRKDEHRSRTRVREPQRNPYEESDTREDRERSRTRAREEKRREHKKYLADLEEDALDILYDLRDGGGEKNLRRIIAKFAKYLPEDFFDPDTADGDPGEPDDLDLDDDLDDDGSDAVFTPVICFIDKATGEFLTREEWEAHGRPAFEEGKDGQAPVVYRVERPNRAPEWGPEATTSVAAAVRNGVYRDEDYADELEEARNIYFHR